MLELVKTTVESGEIEREAEKEEEEIVEVLSADWDEVAHEFDRIKLRRGV